MYFFMSLIPKLLHLYDFCNNTEKYLELIWHAENNRFRLTSNLHGIEHLVREIYGTLIYTKLELTPKVCLKSFQTWSGEVFLSRNSQNTPICISRGLYVVPELSVPSTERSLMFVLATNKENFGFVAFVLENTDFFGDLPKSDYKPIYEPMSFCLVPKFFRNLNT